MGPPEDARRGSERDPDCGRIEARRAGDCKWTTTRGPECKSSCAKYAARNSVRYDSRRRSYRRRTLSLSELFIHRPIMTTLVMAAILLFGVFAYQLLPVSDLPNVDFPTILVSASLPGASPDTMEIGRAHV